MRVDFVFAGLRFPRVVATPDKHTRYFSSGVQRSMFNIMKTFYFEGALQPFNNTRCKRINKDDSLFNGFTVKLSVVRCLSFKSEQEAIDFAKEWAAEI